MEDVSNANATYTGDDGGYVKLYTNTSDESNIELLRILAMLLVVLVHANYYSLGAPTREDILSSPRAQAIYDGFSRRTPAEALCRRCGYAERFG